MIFKAMGNLRAIQILLGQSKIEKTVRYLGIDVEDAFLRGALLVLLLDMCLRG